MTTTLLLSIIGITILYFVFKKNKTSKWKEPKTDFPRKWYIILRENIAFYNGLDADEKKQFEYKIQEFLLNCKITGVNVNIDDKDRILVAASAIIPIFAFPEWRYFNLNEVLIYPDRFGEKFEQEGDNRNILGMVGTGYMEGKMILSKKALQHGFQNENDKKNTAIHEFVHLIDKTDGKIDGIPSILLEKQYTLPWIDLISKKIEEIYENRSDINPYGATNKAEFFSVISEYFFEKPKLLKNKHPQLYQLLAEIFDQNLSTRKKAKSNTEIGRNSSCPCGSGKKYKHCCLN